MSLLKEKKNIGLGKIPITPERIVFYGGGLALFLMGGKLLMDRLNRGSNKGNRNLNDFSQPDGSLYNPGSPTLNTGNLFPGSGPSFPKKDDDFIKNQEDLQPTETVTPGGFASGQINRFAYDARVAKLQGMLNKLGANLTIDGQYGNATHNAVYKYLDMNPIATMTKSTIYTGTMEELIKAARWELDDPNYEPYN